jgi:hypothetical protein
VTRALIAATLAACLCLVPAAGALADADPPSDVLLVQDTYYPYSPQVSAKAVKQLDALVKTAKSRGFPIRVAIVASVSDLGAVPDLFGHPQKYAPFLENEISFNKRRPLLVVMPEGYGVEEADAVALHGLPSVGKTSDELAAAAIRAIPRLARAAGHTVPDVKPIVGGGTGGHGGPSVPLLAGPAALLALFGIFGLVRTRKSEAADEPEAED